MLRALERGLIVNSTHDTVVRFLPPLIVDKKLVDTACKVLDAVLTESERDAEKAPQQILASTAALA